MEPNTSLTIRVPWDELHPFPHNRGGGQQRTGFDDASIRELAASIREHGVIQPLLVRKLPRKPGFQIICGERRWTAAGTISQKYLLPCLVRDVDDETAMEINTVENLQRTGLHPIEEALGYRRLMGLPRRNHDGKVVGLYTAEDVAARIGKSVGYVYARLKLLRLPEIAKQACLNGKLSTSVGLLIARIPHNDAATRATIEILSPRLATIEAALDPAIEPMSFRDAKRHIATHFMIRLRDTVFDPEDPKLVPFNGKSGGPCSTCPMRAGNLGDAESPDVCTHPPCFRAKTRAAATVVRADSSLARRIHALLLDEPNAALWSCVAAIVAERRGLDAAALPLAEQRALVLAAAIGPLFKRGQPTPAAERLLRHEPKTQQQ